MAHVALPRIAEAPVINQVDRLIALPDAYEYLTETAKKTDASVVRFICFRHGQSLSNLEKKVGGQTVDVELTKLGYSQAEEMGALLSKTGIQIAGGFSSSLVRAQESIKTALTKMGLEDLIPALVKNDKIIEKHFGKDEGVVEAEYKLTQEKEKRENSAQDRTFEQKFTYKAYPEDPHLESLSEVFLRNYAFLKETAAVEAHSEHADKNYLVSTHNVAMKSLLMGMFKQLGVEIGYRSFDLKNCCIFVIEIDRTGEVKLVAASGILPT